MSQAHLAAESGVNRPYLHGIEKGQKNPSLLVLVRLAAALNTTASQLVRHVGG
ncbi:helix-turn-helix transcriptional regulator [Mycobacteroides abscessus subsp. abscessus]|nr:helix-turn-helix transcriptional regulator [Mycobacteroides abscessus subsp. abscessus]QSN49692.1 helix-turn-helix transcriptional regulator [Mycobacteroides abscessus subsp. abscessus]RIR16539.1 XRE family transcriptional regulator [Mycobacteroides abscessus]